MPVEWVNHRDTELASWAVRNMGGRRPEGLKREAEGDVASSSPKVPRVGGPVPKGAAGPAPQPSPPKPPSEAPVAARPLAPRAQVKARRQFLPEPPVPMVASPPRHMEAEELATALLATPLGEKLGQSVFTELRARNLLLAKEQTEKQAEAVKSMKDSVAALREANAALRAANEAQAATMADLLRRAEAA